MAQVTRKVHLEQNSYCEIHLSIKMSILIFSFLKEMKIHVIIRERICALQKWPPHNEFIVAYVFVLGDNATRPPA